MRFFYRITLGLPDPHFYVPGAKVPSTLPQILNHDELVRLFTVTTNLRHRAVSMTAYAAGLRASELGRLQVSDIDSARMCLRVDQGKGSKDRYIPLSPRLLEHESLDHVEFLSRLVELELIDRERRLVERRIKAAKFPTVKSLDSFEFKAIPSLSKVQVLELARCEWIEWRENVIALGPSGTGKTHVAQGLGLAACQRGLSERFVTAAALVHELMEARDERRLLRLQKGVIGRFVPRITLSILRWGSTRGSSSDRD